MTEGQPRRSASTDNSKSRKTAPLWTALLVAAFLVFATAGAQAATSGGISSTGGTGTTSGSTSGTSSTGSSLSARYARIYDRFSTRNKRWARRTGACESGNNPRAVSPGGRYRGAFQFSRRTWRGAPKSPGGDPIRYTWKVQAVVAVYLKRRDGRGQWPVCG